MSRTVLGQDRSFRLIAGVHKERGAQAITQPYAFP